MEFRGILSGWKNQENIINLVFVGFAQRAKFFMKTYIVGIH